MAIQYIDARFISRSAGHNSLAAAAYRANENLFSEGTSETFDYTNKNDCVYKEILLPENAFNDKYTKENHPYFDREKIWNAVEDIENGHNRRATAQLSMELKIALPKEITPEQQAELARNFIQENYVDKFGVAADICIHDKGDGNPHAHVMITLRQLNGVNFSKKKERSIAPRVMSSEHGAFCIPDTLNDLWRGFQNRYFEANNLDLKVDEVHIIPTVHEGRVRDSDNYYGKVEENKEIKKDNLELVLSEPEKIIQILEDKYAVFDKRDIEKMVFTQTEVSTNPNDYHDVLNKVLASDKLVKLGYSEAGRLSYTTLLNSNKEIAMMDMANNMRGQDTLNINSKLIESISKNDGLSDEQTLAIKHITQSGKIACLFGSAGAGKTKLMKSLNDIYSSKNINVFGGAVAGKAAQGLEDGAGIKSNTIASILHTYSDDSKHRFLPAKGSVFVVDEAGMIGLKDMNLLVEMSQKRNYTLVLVGDPEQLQPVAKGAPFRAILERVGFASLKEIWRQSDEAERKVTQKMAQGKIGDAIDHYLADDRVILDDPKNLKVELFNQWQDYADDLNETIILAHTQKDVEELNHHARSYLISKGKIEDSQIFSVNVSGQTKSKQFAVNERIIFLKNDRTLDVKNGQLGQIIKLKDSQIAVKLDNGNIINFNAKDYQNFDHGYAVTVHKAQGVTVDNCLAYASGKGWDRFLTYVALSRHRHNVHLYADKESYKDIQGLKRQLGSSPLRDNVLDYPLQFAIRRGADATQFANNAVDKIKGTYHKTKNTWNFLFNYSQYITDRENATRQHDLQSKQDVNREAVQVADLADLHRDVMTKYHEFKGNYGEKWYENKEAKEAYKEIEDAFYERNKVAYSLYTKHDKFERALSLNNITVENLEEWSASYTAENRVRTFENAHGYAVKGKLAQAINDNPDSNRYVSSRNLWDEVNKTQTAHVTRIKSGQFEGFSKRLRTVEKYLAENRSATGYWKKSQGKKPSEEDQKKTIDAQVKDDATKKEKTILPEHLRIYENISKAFNVKSEILAAKIMNDFDNYQPVLAVKFPYQATYDKVVTNLKRKADNFAKRETIKTYINPDSTQLDREKAAYKLNQDFKGHVGMGYEEGLLWGNVGKTAYPEKIRQARSKLAPEYLPMFDSVQEYQTLCQESATQFVIVKEAEQAIKKELGIKESGKIPKDKITDEFKNQQSAMFKIMAERHELAYKLNDNYPELGNLYQNDSEKLDDMIPNFKIDKFQRHIKLHQERLDAQERVEQYSSLDISKVNERMELAHVIAQRIGKHSFHLKKLNVDVSAIWKLSTAYQYQLDNEKYNGDDKILHRSLADYMMARDEVSQHWRDIRTLKANGTNAETIKAKQQDGFALSDKRNKVAFEVCNLLGKNIDSPVYESFTENKLAYKNIDLTQLIKFADDYRVVDDISRYATLDPASNQAQRLAGEISEQYKKGVVYHKLKGLNVDSQAFYNHATDYRRNEYKQGLSLADRGYHDTVIKYSNSVIDVAKAFKGKDKKFGNDLIIKRDLLAFKIAQSPSLYEDALLFEDVNFDKLDKHIANNQQAQKVEENNPLDGVYYNDSPDNFEDAVTKYYHDQDYVPLEALEDAKTERASIHVPQAGMSSDNKKYTRWNYQRITDELMVNPIDTYSSIFGQPKKQSSRELRWSGGLIVTLTGSNAGKWYDFAQDKGGLPIQAIMHNQGLSYVDALKEGASISHLTDSEAKTEDYASQRPVQPKAPHEDKEQAYRIESAQSIWNSTVPVENTIVEEYMAVHRNVYDISKTELRLLPVGAKWINYVEDQNNKGVYIREEKINKVPAMVISSMDKDNKVVGVQCTYLDPTTDTKNTYFDNPKLSKGSIKNGAVLQAGNNGIVYIAEGVETGASIALADRNATVLISMSVGNMHNMVEKIKAHEPKEVIILKDNDGVNAKSDIGFNKAVDAYKQAGLDVKIKEPEMLERIVKARGKDAKTDWNDVIQENGLYCLCDDLGLPEPSADRNYLVRLYNAKNPKVRIKADSPEAKRIIDYVMLENKSLRGVYKSKHSTILNDAEKNGLFDHSVLNMRKSAYKLVTDVKTNKYLDKFEQLKNRMYDNAEKYVKGHLKGDTHYDHSQKLSRSKISDHGRHIAALDKSIKAKEAREDTNTRSRGQGLSF